MCCGSVYDNPVNKFYKTPWSNLYDENDHYFPVCIDCLKKKFEEYSKRYGEATAMKILCHYMDMPFYFSLYDNIIKNNDNFKIGMYFRLMNQKQYTNKTFVNTLIDKKELGLDDSSYEEEKEVKWSAADTRDKNGAIEIIGYDPFEGYNEADRRFLFKNIIGYLDEDGIEDDSFKISQIVQLVNNNYQIKQIDMAVAKLNPQTEASEIKILSDLKKKLVDNNDKIAKENGISVKNRLNQEAGRATLTHLMKDLREKDFTKAETNYYDQLKSEGTQWAANVSLKAIRENGFFDENDNNDMLEIQYVKIKELQSKLDDVEESNRLLLIDNDNLKAQIKSDGESDE